MVFERKLEAVVSQTIIDEYYGTAEYLQKKYSEKISALPLSQLIQKMEVITPLDDIHICRDPDDDKFIFCARDGKCIFIVSGDNDLLSIKHYGNIKIIKIHDFFEMTDF